MFMQLLANGLVTGSVIALAAAGISIVYGILRLVNFAYGDYMTFGAFAGILFNVKLGLPIVLAAVIAMAATALLSVALEFVLWRPLRAKSAGFMSLFLVSVGLALVLRHVIYLVAGPQPRTYAVDPYKVYVIGSARLSGAQGIAIVVAAVGIVLIGLLIAGTGVGRMMRALADDLPLAAVAGVRTGRVIVAAWIVSGLLAGLAGVLAGLVQTSFDPQLGFTLLLPIFAAVVLGGIGNVYGALAGGLALGLAMELSTWTELAGGVNPTYKPVVAFGALVLVLLLRPQGLFGRARVV
ncbi:MAG: branched-chain amino acid ABC transporter permease [Actinobacteria bacterium]|nr:MAG: branched-chain amino acid ABC transporter permease [Actinomycetota bacterium]